MHVVFGAGQVGSPLVEALRSRGLPVRVVRRSAGAVAAGVERFTGDATDRDTCVRACAGATVVYHCVGAPYSTKVWRELLPRLQANLVHAAGSAGARLVVLDNLYALGRPPAAIDERSPVAPISEKGRIRAELSAALLDAHLKGQVKTVIGRAAHFFGPGVTQSQLGEHFFSRVSAGKSAMVFGDPDARHCFSYAPDVAEGLAHLGTADDSVTGLAHVLPVMPATPVRVLIQALLDRLGSRAPIERISPLMMRLFGVFAPPVRELIEMNYEWQSDYVVDDSRFRARFDFRGTPLDEALAATASWARHTFTRAA